MADVDGNYSVRIAMRQLVDPMGYNAQGWYGSPVRLSEPSVAIFLVMFI